MNSGDGYLNNNSRVLIWDRSGNNDQQWSLHLYGFTHDGAPRYQLINLMSRKCMEVRNNNTLNGTRVDQFTCQTSGDITAADTQLWRLGNANANGAYKVMQPWSALRVGARMCLDIFNGDDGNGTKVEQWTCNGGGNQEFIGFPGSLSLPASGLGVARYDPSA